MPSDDVEKAMLILAEKIGDNEAFRFPAHASSRYERLALQYFYMYLAELEVAHRIPLFRITGPPEGFIFQANALKREILPKDPGWLFECYPRIAVGERKPYSVVFLTHQQSHDDWAQTLADVASRHNEGQSSEEQLPAEPHNSDDDERQIAAMLEELRYVGNEINQTLTRMNERMATVLAGAGTGE